jgi:hypothetical protein
VSATVTEQRDRETHRGNGLSERATATESGGAGRRMVVREDLQRGVRKKERCRLLPLKSRSGTHSGARLPPPKL